jgi:hypothetical protein
VVRLLPIQKLGVVASYNSEKSRLASGKQACRDPVYRLGIWYPSTNRKKRKKTRKMKHSFVSKALSACGLFLAPLAAQAGFDFSQYGTLAPATGWTIVSGQFAGNSLADVAAYHPSNGSVWVGRNTGSKFSFTQYATLTPASGWVIVAGQFAGSSLADLMAYHPSNGSIHVGRNTGSTFSFTQYATLAPASGWKFLAGQFAAGGLADVVGYFPADHGNTTKGSLWVGRNTGSTFSFTQYATVSPASGWEFAAGQFAGSSLADVVGYFPADHGNTSKGSLWVGRNTGSTFSFSQYATVSPASGWKFVAGQFAESGLADVVGYFPADHGDTSKGSVWVGQNTGSAFLLTPYATVSPASGWKFAAGQFAGDTLTDVIGYVPSDHGDTSKASLWVGRNTGPGGS